MTWPHNLYFHAWHWLFTQIQLDNWFGNIVAGVVGYLLARDRYKKFHEKLHAPALRHLQHIVKHHPDIPDLEDE